MAEAERILTIAVETVEAVQARVRQALGGEPAGERWSFSSRDLLLKMLTPRRFDVIEAMAGAGPLSIREVARRLKRDVKAVHGDVHYLLDKQAVLRNSDGKFEFPYDAVRVDFLISRAA